MNELVMMRTLCNKARNESEVEELMVSKWNRRSLGNHVREKNQARGMRT